MNVRLKLVGSLMFVGSLVWLLVASSAWANPLTGLTIDSACDTTTHTVTITTADINTNRFATIQGQVLIGGTWTNSGSPETVPIPIGRTTTTVKLTIPTNGGTAYRAVMVASDLDNATGRMTNEVHCVAATATPTMTLTPTMTPTPVPTSTATATATPTQASSSGGGGGGGSSRPKPAPTAVLQAESAPSAPSAPAVAAPAPPPPAPPTATPTSVIQVAGAQAAAPAQEAPAQAPAPVAVLPPPPPPPPCVEGAVVPVLDELTGNQLVDLASGQPMWLVSGDDSGVIVVGPLCARADVPLGLPATGDGSTETGFVDDQGGPVLAP